MMSQRWMNIIENDGFGIAGVGILLVFAVLLLISIYISLLPKLLSLVNPFLDPPAAKRPPAPGPETSADRDTAIAAAAALHHHLTRTES